MGVPQTRHRVFFVGIRNDLGVDPVDLDMSFYYEPVRFREIKSGTGGEVGRESLSFRALQMAIPEDKDLAAVYKRIGERERCFTTRIVWEDDIPPTLTARTDQYRGEEKTRVSIEDLIHIQTFPEDFDFIRNTYYRALYVCAMSVPPVMIKRIVSRMIEAGVFEKKEKTP
jgi:DNA (cytosine-5)-methyltransferase 1